MTRRWLAVVAVLLVAAVGCHSSGSTTSGGPTGVGSKNPKLLAAAKLATCPTSTTSATQAAGGLPNVTLACLGNGPAVNLAGLGGKPAVVNLWAGWCEPCQQEEPFFSSTYTVLKHQVQFLGVDIEDTDNNALSFDAHVTPPVRYPSVVDPSKTVLDDLHFTGPPQTLFVNAAGKIVYVHHSLYTSAAALKADISTHLHVSA